MGRNGAGKSTLLKLLVEELKPSDGLVALVVAQPAGGAGELCDPDGYPVQLQASQ